MAKYLSPEWLDLLADTASDRPGPAAVTGRVQHVVTGGPDGDVTYHVELAAGVVVAAGPGPDAGAALTLTTTYEVATAILTGDLDVAVAYMQGRLRAEGHMPLLYALLAFVQSDTAAARLAHLRSRTEV